MKTLEQISLEHQREIKELQRKILESCWREVKEYGFLENNMPPEFYTTYLCSITGDPAKPYHETAPHWNPSLKKLAEAMLKDIDSKQVNLPLQENNPLRKEVFVLDRNGIIDVGLWISDKGINCRYEKYIIVDTLSPFLGNAKLSDIDPFYVFRDKR